MSKQETSLSEAHQTNYINGWFDVLTFARDDPKTKYTTNVRYQNICAKIELVEEELNSHEKSPVPDQDGGISRNGTCINCDTPSQRKDKTISKDRNMLLADILRILPEIRQHLL